MSMGGSGKKPTRKEVERIVASKEGECMACAVLAERGDLAPELVVVGCDYNHAKSGNIRRGHRWGFALCIYHHRRHPYGQWSFKQMREFYGPSLMDGSALFHDTFGSDDDLIARQDAAIGWVDA